MSIAKIILKLRHLKRDCGYVSQLIKLSFSESTNYLNPPHRIFFHGVKLLLKYRFTPYFSKDLGILNPSTEISVIEQLISRERFSEIQLKINPLEFTPLTENKGLFYHFCRLNKIPHPEVYAEYFKDSFGFIKDFNGLPNETDWVEWFENKSPNEIVIKPHLGVYGHGILPVKRLKNKLYDFSGKEMLPDTIIDFIKNNKEFNSFLIQERLKAHKSLKILTGNENISSVRIVTLIEKNDDVKILYAAVKLVSGKNFIDNHERGSTGNVIALLDISNGEIQTAFCAADKLGKAGEVNLHPISGKEIIGFRIPMWSDLVNTVKFAALKFKPLRTAGWDAAVTDDGIKILEANALFDPPNFFSKGRIIEKELLEKQ